MREILFKGYSKEDKQWHYGSLIHTIEGYFVMPIEDGDLYPVEEESIGQYTGFKDYKGNKIFEGDRIEYLSHETGEVVWDEKLGQYWFNEYCVQDINFSDYEVVGTTYETEQKEFINE